MSAQERPTRTGDLPATVLLPANTGLLHGAAARRASRTCKLCGTKSLRRAHRLRYRKVAALKLFSPYPSNRQTSLRFAPATLVNRLSPVHLQLELPAPLREPEAPRIGEVKMDATRSASS